MVITSLDCTAIDLWRTHVADLVLLVTMRLGARPYAKVTLIQPLCFLVYALFFLVFKPWRAIKHTTGRPVCTHLKHIEQLASNRVADCDNTRDNNCASTGCTRC